MPTRLPPTRSSCRALGRRRWPSIAPRRQLPDFLGRTRARAGWLVASQVGRCLRRRTPLPSSSSAGRKPKPLGSRSRTFSSRWARVLPHQAVRCWYRAYSPAPTISRRCVAGRVPPESRSESPRHASGQGNATSIPHRRRNSISGGSRSIRGSISGTCMHYCDHPEFTTLVGRSVR